MRSLILILPLLLISCTAGTKTAPPPLADGYPPDFSLTLLYGTGDDRWLYLIEPDRTLRAASGEGVGLNTYPPRTARLTPQQMAQVYRLSRPFISHRTRYGELSPQSADSDEAFLHDTYLILEIPPDATIDDPKLHSLIHYLTALRGGEPG